MRHVLALAAGLAAAGCNSDDGFGPGGPGLPAPTNLRYTLEPSGTPGEPSGILLHWDFSNDPALRVWHVYSRASQGQAFRLRGSTTSNSFHDVGIPHLEYYVTAEDAAGVESPPSNVVTIDERLTLPHPQTLATITLNGAIGLTWDDAPARANPPRFGFYRVYSASYDLDRGLCLDDWAVEGTTVSPEFVVGALTNGVPLCFGVSAVSIEGYESLRSPIRSDTPRPDARNVVIWVRQANPGQSGFRFWRDGNGDGRAQSAELGVIGSGNATDIDFYVDRDPQGRLFLVPVRTGTGVLRYGTAPIADLTSIDVAPVGVYSAQPVEALPGWGYVFQMSGGDGFARFGALRPSHVGRDFVIVDWAFQTDPGNPDLVRAR